MSSKYEEISTSIVSAVLDMIDITEKFNKMGAKDIDAMIASALPGAKRMNSTMKKLLELDTQIATIRQGITKAGLQAMIAPKEDEDPKAEEKPKADDKPKTEEKSVSEEKVKVEDKPIVEEKTKVEEKPKSEQKPKTEVKSKAKVKPEEKSKGEEKPKEDENPKEDEKEKKQKGRPKKTEDLAKEAPPTAAEEKKKGSSKKKEETKPKEESVEIPVPSVPAPSPVAIPETPKVDDLSKQKDMEDDEPLHIRRKNIPKHVKTLVWGKYIGNNNPEAKCYSCRHERIDIRNFHCGHVLAEAKGGSCTIDNLRPICAPCNGSMGTQSMNEFTSKYFGWTV